MAIVEDLKDFKTVGAGVHPLPRLTRQRGSVPDWLHI